LADCLSFGYNVGLKKLTVKTVLLVDSDLGFVFWLGHALDSAGYEALPAKSVSDAIALLVQYRLSIDLLILNPSLAGAPGFAEDVRTSQRHAKIIVLAESTGAMQGGEVSHPKPDRIDEIAKLEWLDLIHNVLAGEAKTAMASSSVHPPNLQ
jgi:hypothetical protein